MKRKFGLEGELEVVVSHATLSNCMWNVHAEGWQEEVGGKSSLKLYRLAKRRFLTGKACEGIWEQGRSETDLGRGRCQWDSWVTRRGVVCVRMVNVSYVMNVLQKMCLFCYTVEFACDRGRLLGMIEGIEEIKEWMVKQR